MANHTRCFHTVPDYETVEASIRQQFYSGEGAIQYVPEAIARANADLLDTADKKAAFINLYLQSPADAGEYLEGLVTPQQEPMTEKELSHRLSRYGLNPCGEIIGSDFHCNLAEIHLNTIDPKDQQAQDDAFKAGALQVAALLHHEFYIERYRYSREIDPIVGVSFTGFFDLEAVFLTTFFFAIIFNLNYFFLKPPLEPFPLPAFNLAFTAAALRGYLLVTD